jgi:hypothetical protein
MRQEAQRTPPARVLEPRLQREHLAEPQREAPRNREMRLRLPYRAVASVSNGRELVPLFRGHRFDDLGDGTIEEQRQQKCGRQRTARGGALIGVGEPLHQQPLDEAAGVSAEIGIHVGQELRQQPSPPQHFQALGPVAREKQLQHLIEEARRGHTPQKLAQPPDGFGRCRVDPEAELRLETRRAQHAYRVFPKACLRITDQPQAPGRNVFDTAAIVPNGEVGYVVVERIGREIAAPDVFINGAVDVVPQDAAGRVERTLRSVVEGRPGFPAEGIGWSGLLGSARLLASIGLPVSRSLWILIELRRLAILWIGVRQRLLTLRRRGRGAEGGDLDDLLAEEDVGQPEPPPYQAAIAEQALYLLRKCVRSHVEILRLHAEQEVPHAAADQKPLKSRVFQAVEHPQRIGRDMGPGNRVLRPRNDPRLGRGRHRLRLGRVQLVAFGLSIGHSSL